MSNWNGYNMGINQFYAFFDNEGYIVASDYSGNKRIGVSLQKFSQIEKLANDAMAKAEEYLKILEENDLQHLIKRELTPDEKINALSGQVETLTKLVEQLVLRDGEGNAQTDNKTNGVENNAKPVAAGGAGKGFIASEQPLAQ